MKRNAMCLLAAVAVLSAVPAYGAAAPEQGELYLVPFSHLDYFWGGTREEFRSFRDEVVASLGKKSFIDVRSPEEFRGEKLAPDHLPQEQSQVPGHIPGAA